MSIEIKISKKRISYKMAMLFLNKRVEQVKIGKKRELLWILEHPTTYTAGVRFNKKEILDKKIRIVQSNRGGKITYHGPGQLICYFVIDLKKGKKDIRKFISVIEKSIIETLSLYDIETFADKENIGIWYNDNSTIKKVAAIGVRVSKWIAYHGFSININNDLKKYDAIIPCGIKDKGITNLKQIKNQNYGELKNKLIEIFKTNLKNLIFQSLTTY